LSDNYALFEPSSKGQNNTSEGLIIPQEDDPVLFTTEDGLDIKFGLGTLQSGNLSGFPYFSTYSSSSVYTWVIIGTNNTALTNDNILSHETFSVWSTRLAHPNVSEYMNSQYETSSDAGSLINSTIVDSYLSYEQQSVVTSNVVENTTEIPEGCVLVLANDIISTGIFNDVLYRYIGNSSPKNNLVPSVYGRISEYGYNKYNVANICSTMNSYYSGEGLGLSMIRSRIKTITVTTTGGLSSASDVQKNLQVEYSASVFPLSNNGSFIWSNYLTAEQIKLSSNQWLRSGSSACKKSDIYNNVRTIYHVAHYIDSNGKVVKGYVNDTAGYRPAFVMQL
ncbi:MAG: hypothetical protein ACLRFR_04105, partial [Clostridia bacterium]